MSAVDVLTVVVFAAAKVGVLVGLAATLARALRRAPAAARYGVWVATLTGALLLPLVTQWVPSWTLWTRPAVPALPAMSVVSASSAGSSAATFPSRGPAATAPIGRASLCVACDLTDSTAGSALPRTSSSEAFEGLAPAWARVTEIPAATWLLSVWMAGASVILLGLGKALYAVRGLERKALPVEGAWLRALDEARARVGVRRPVRLLRSPAIHTPMTWGALRPVILLPEASREWCEERRRIVLHHELSHVRRGDWLARLLARSVCALYWLNPLVWLAGRRLVLEQEKACDEAVVELGDRPSSYARHLLAIAASMQRHSHSPVLALDMARRSQMEGRLMSILDGSRSRPGRRAFLVPAVLVIALVPALAALEPWADEEVAAVQVPGITLDTGSIVAGSDVEPSAATGATIGSQGPSAGRVPTVGPVVDTGGVSRVLGELSRLERELAPFERELEAIESEMEPIEEGMEEVQGRFEPFEDELEAVEAQLEPFEDRLEALEDELAPYEDRLETVAAELEPFEKRLEALEVEIEPYEGRFEAVEDELEPFEDQLDTLGDSLEPLGDEIDRLDDQYDATDSVAERERLLARMEEVRRDMEPIHAQMRAVNEEMRAVNEEMRPVHERMRSIHQAMQPVHERMQSIHEKMQPVHERMRAIHEEMRPVHERMNAVHERMQPVHAEMGEHHERMEPLHRKMGEIHERMRPLHEEMADQHRAMHEQLTGVVETMLAAHLGAAVASGTVFSGVAEEIVDESSLMIDDGRLRIRCSIPALRELLHERFSAVQDHSQFDSAVERFLEAYSNLEVGAG